MNSITMSRNGSVLTVQMKRINDHISIKEERAFDLLVVVHVGIFVEEECTVAKQA